MTIFKHLRPQFPLSLSAKWGYHFYLGQNRLHKPEKREQEGKMSLASPAWVQAEQLILAPARPPIPAWPKGWQNPAPASLERV